MGGKEREDFQDGKTIKQLVIGGKGRIEVIVGSMFAGKTEEIIKKVKRTLIQIEKLKANGLIPKEIEASQIVLVFKHQADNRYGDDGEETSYVTSHNEARIEATKISHPDEIYQYITEDTAVVGIDEAQFFGEYRDQVTPEGEVKRIYRIVEVADDLATKKKIRVIVGGLELDFRGEDFGPMPQMMSHSTDITKLFAICTVCGEDAERTQRLVNGEPAKYSDPVILVGAAESYEARCREHHQVPR